MWEGKQRVRASFLRGLGVVYLLVAGLAGLAWAFMSTDTFNNWGWERVGLRDPEVRRMPLDGTGVTIVKPPHWIASATPSGADVALYEGAGTDPVVVKVLVSRTPVQQAREVASSAPGPGVVRQEVQLDGVTGVCFTSHGNETQFTECVFSGFPIRVFLLAYGPRGAELWDGGALLDELFDFGARPAESAGD
jgi:hypothetical protein